MYVISFYVPLEFAERVKEALFAAGAGRIGAYDSCAWQTVGRGQFRPLPGSRPYWGQEDALESVEEAKVEMVCQDEVVEAVVQALRAAHPYETPAYYVLRSEEPRPSAKA